MKNLKRRTRLLLAITGAAAVLAAVISFALLGPASQANRKPGAAPVNPLAVELQPTLAQLAAADSDTVVMAPYSADWWKKISAMAPAPMGLLKVDPATAPAPLLRLGYTRGPDHAKREIPNTGPLRRVYLETGSADDAAKVAGWLKAQPEFEGRRVFVQDRTVIAGQSWDTGFSAPEKTMQTVAAYQPGNATDQASMWMNVDQEVVSLAGGADTAAGKVYSAVLSKGVGFKAGTTWTGFSDTGDTWKGDYRSGGVDKAQISFDDAREVLGASDKVLFETKSGLATTKFIDSGAGAVMNKTSIMVDGQKLGSGPAVSGFPEVDHQDVALVSDVTNWNAAATGTYSGQELIGQRTLSANDKSMVLTYTYADPSATADAGAGHAPFGPGNATPNK